MATLIIQSFRTNSVPLWIRECLSSVSSWAESQKYSYQFIGDEIFDEVPSWYLDKIGNKLPVATDYARLKLIERALVGGQYQRVIWLDADILVFDQSLKIAFNNSCAFGQEVWIQKEGSKYKAVKNVHNAVCAFKQGCPTLPFLIQTVESIIGRVDGNKIAPQMVGPKLLTALHNIAGFSLLPEIGALSPEVIEDIIEGGGKALALLKLKSQVPLKAVNLCASLVCDESAEEVIDKILSTKI